MADRSRARTTARGERGRAEQRASARAPPRWQPPRALADHPHLTAAGLLALLVLALLWPALLGGKVLSPAAVLYKLAPWQPYRPHDVASFENYLLADVPLVTVPWHELARQLLHAGTLPAWNPHVLTGVPFFSNPQTGIFTPFSLPLWILPLNYALGLTAALMLWAAGFGTYLLARELRLGFLPGLVAGIAFALCSLNVTWLTTGALPGVAVMAPWLLWLVERTFARPDRRLASALGLAVVTAVALGGGHPGTQVHVMTLAGLYALARAALLQNATRRERLRPLALTGGALALGALLMGAMLVPEVLSSHGTVGTIARKGGASSLPGAQHMPFTTIRTLLLPDWWGRPSAFETDDSPVKTALQLNYEERTFYAGVVPLLLAAIALTASGWRASWRRTAPFAALGALALAIALHAPGLFQLVEHLPVFELIENQRLHFVFELCVAVLAGFGLQELIERPREQRGRRLAVAGVALGAALVAAAGAHVHGGDVGHALEHFLTGKDTPSSGVVELTSAGWLGLLALGTGAGLLALRRWPGRRDAIVAGLVLLAALDLLHFAHGYEPMGPAGKAIPPRTPAIAYLQRHAADGRFAGVELALPPDTAVRFGLADVRGYDPPYPTERYFDLWREASPEQTGWRPLTFDGIPPVALRVTSVLGARYVVAEPGTTKPDGADPFVRGLRRVYDARDATIFENPRALPRALVAPAVRLVPDAEAARQAIVEDGFDPRRTVLAERGEPSAGARGAHGRVAVAHESNAQVTLTATLDRRGLVVLDDELTPGWSVRVDGRAAPALHADDVMRGVVVPAGRHEIVWSYAVPGLGTGAALSALGLAALIAAAALVVRRRRAA
jgi:hypothetical protein